MSDSGQAVFLSYASQDAEAARGICDALRAAGVEVWFDQSELRGGDAWDAKIRKQIATCDLFIPVISANTQARLEGYFRIEWKLAAQRTHAMAEEKAFLLPVVIDDTRDAEGRVPAEFKAVQWTRLKLEATPAEFALLVQALLTGNAGTRPASPAGASALPKKRRHWPWPLFAAAVALVGAMAWWQPWEKRSARESPELMRVRQLADQGSANRSDLELAVATAKRLTGTQPENVEAWAWQSIAQSLQIMRGYDAGRGADAESRQAAERALSLDRDSPDAALAMGLHLASGVSRSGDVTGAEAYLQRAKNSAHPDLAHIGLALLYRQAWRIDDVARECETVLQMNPQHQLAAYYLSAVRAWQRRPEEAARLKVIALAGGRGLLGVRAVTGWATATFSSTGDLQECRRLMDKLDPTERTDPRVMVINWHLAYWGRDGDVALQAIGSLPDAYIVDNSFSGPKGTLAGLAHRLAGRLEPARVQFEEAERVARERLRQEPGDETARLRIVQALALLGRQDEARRELRTVESAVNARPPSLTRMFQRGTIGRIHAELGDVEPALPYLRDLLLEPNLPAYTPKAFAMDPDYDRVRDDPRVQAIVREAARLGDPGSASPTPDAKSIAVLAFDNLSDDKANEYFSDGISEELIDRLGRVPGLTVKGSTSAFYFKGNKQVLPAEIGRQLGVAYLVRGSVRKDGNKVLIAARLTQAADDRLIWSSDPITRELKDVLTLQQEIAGLIVTNLSLKLGGGSGGQTAAVNPQALEFYLQGRQAWNLRTRPGFDRAEDLLNRALAIAPDFARAHAALADVWNTRGQASETLGRFEQRGGAEVGRIIAKAREALALDPDSAEAHTALGLALLQDWKLPEAERELRHAIALNPSFASAHQMLGRLREGQGYLDDALLSLQRAADLDPLSPRILSNYAIMLNHAGRWREALAATDRALAIHSDDSQAMFTKANALMYLGRVDEATTLVRRLESGYETQSVIFAEAGLKPEAEAALAKTDPRLRLTSRIRALLALGRREAALALLEPGSITVNSSANFLFEEKLDPIRGAPEFVRIIRDLGLVEPNARAQAWRAAHPPEKAAPNK